MNVYNDVGLTVLGVHTPEFTFAQYESNVERGVREFGLTYPIVIDSNFEIWKAFANRCWPSKYLLDKDGYLRFAHPGEGAYRECEEVIQELLREIDPEVLLPEPLAPIRAEDKPGAVCFPATPNFTWTSPRPHWQRQRLQRRSGCRLRIHRRVG